MRLGASWLHCFKRGASVLWAKLAKTIVEAYTQKSGSILVDEEGGAAAIEGLRSPFLVHCKIAQKKGVPGVPGVLGFANC